QPEHELHLMVFAPTHQLVTAKTGISPHDDFHFRPCRPDLRYNPADFSQAAERRIMIGFPQPRAQYMLSAENVKPQITIAVVIPVEESPLLLAMQRQVGGIHIQNELIGSLRLRLDEYLHQQLIDRFLPESNFLISIRGPGAQFHSVQRTLARLKASPVPGLPGSRIPDPAAVAHDR